jgi:ubiquinone/menaquinone biosynthesis C-methylase UbiE
MLNDSNRKLYTARSIVQHYTQLKQLQPAEQTILERFQNQWATMRMLDIGVGGGRTTQHFSKLVREYVGIDYSPEMIGACQKRFAASPQTTAFEVCDARDMSRFEDNSFDFIMFSFNGIDYVSHSDRLKVFQEVSRVSKPGGYFFFSSHNLQRMEQEFNWKKQISMNPITTYINLVMLTLLRCFNYSTTLEQLNLSTHAIIKDESHNFRLKTYYVRIQEQINQLEAGFSNIQVFSWENGSELKASNEWTSNTDMWLYYLCTTK